MLNFYHFFNKHELYNDELYYDPLFNLNKVWMPDLNCQYSNIHHIIKKRSISNIPIFKNHLRTSLARGRINYTDRCGYDILLHD